MQSRLPRKTETMNKLSCLPSGEQVFYDERADKKPKALRNQQKVMAAGGT